MNRSNPSPPSEKPAAGAKTAVRTVTVPEDRGGQRLDNFLLGQLKGAPRSLVYKLVRSGQVRVNGGRAKAERKLEGGDEVGFGRHGGLGADEPPGIRTGRRSG